MSKIVRKIVSHVTLEKDEKLCMVDSGSFAHAIDAEEELPDHDIEPIPSDEHSQDGESACGGIMKQLGRVKTRGLVNGKSLNVHWNAMKVKVPILSVQRLVHDHHNVRFKKGGGYIKNLLTGERIPIFEYQGVYYLKMKILPPTRDVDPVFSRPVP